MNNLPPMTDLHQLFNPNIAPPLISTKTAQSPTGSSGITGSVRLKFFKGIQRKSSKHDHISLPTNFRHVVHVGSDKIEVYDEKGGPIEKRKQSFEISLERKQSGFGMNIRTLEDGKTIVSLVMEGGAAEQAGIMMNDEITQIDGEDIEGLKHEDVIGKLKGKESVKLNIVRFTDGKEKDKDEQYEGLGCRICGSLATFNCSACGPHITYCSPECQKADWVNHKQDCQATKQKTKVQGASSVPLTGACRVCRAKNARFRCACGSAMYCSEKCQISDWPNHKTHCISQEEEKDMTEEMVKFTFFAISERWLSKMVFMNGVFDCKWTVPLVLAEDEKYPIHPTLLVSNAEHTVFVTYSNRLAAIDSSSGNTLWMNCLNYPFNGQPMSIEHTKNSLIIGGNGHLIGIDKQNGNEKWRKLLSHTFDPITMLLQGKLLFACSGKILFCLLLEDDNLKLNWKTQVSAFANPKAMVLYATGKSGPSILTGSDKLSNVKIINGQTQKTKSQEAAITATTISLKDDIFLVLHNGTLSRYSLPDFTVQWEIKIPDCEGKEGTILQNRIVFLSNNEQGTPTDVAYIGIFCRVVAIDVQAGALKWVAKLTKEETGTMNIVTMNLLGDDLIAATAGRVYALSANSGNPLRKAQLPQKDNQTKFISLVSLEGSDSTVSCLGNIGSLFARV